MANDCNWRLQAASIAAKNLTNKTFTLRAGENKVGKKKDCHIKIPSVLCSREHCTIYLKGDQVSLEDVSSNGTYITHGGDIGTKKYVKETTEEPLGENDLISFGFNTATVYDHKDANAFIYVLKKEQIETIDIGDSDDDYSEEDVVDEDVDEQSSGKYIDIDDKVITIDSNSDSEYSGEECVQNINDVKDEFSSGDSQDSKNDSSNDTDECSYSDSSESGQSDELVVTKTIHNCAEPEETIALDDEDDDVQPIDDDNEQPIDDDEPLIAQTKCIVELEQVVEPKKSKQNGCEIPSTSKQAVGAFGTKIEKPQHGQKATERSKETEKPADKAIKPFEQRKKSTDEDRCKPGPSKLPNDDKRLESLKRRIAEKRVRTTTITNAKSIRKRRQTVSEREYNYQKKKRELKEIEKEKERKEAEELTKQQRRDKLAQIGERERKAREEAAERASKIERPQHMPKVKNATITRGEMICTDMMALDPANG